MTWIAGIASALLAGVFPIKAVADLTNIGILAAFVVVCFSVIVFRYKKPDAPAHLPPAADAGHSRLRRPGLGAS